MLLNTIAACGDVNRNVMCNPNPYQSRAHAAALELARAISDHLLPRTPAYREIWLEGEQIAGGEEEVVEPIYGKTYLPRKFKIVVAVPPSNDVDVYAHDLGYIAILDEKGNIAGWNVTVGGGMGMTHGEPDTYPRTADIMGFCAPKTPSRSPRPSSPCSATGATAQTASMRGSNTRSRIAGSIISGPKSRSGPASSSAAEPFTFTSTAIAMAGTKRATARAPDAVRPERPCPGQCGRRRSRPALRRIAQSHDGDFRMTANQN